MIFRAAARAACLSALLATVAAPAAGETLNNALVKAYNVNPTLNSGRAALRALDESVPQALSGMKPRISADATLGVERRRNVADSINLDNNDPSTAILQKSIQNGTGLPRQGALSIEQPLFDGFKSQNATRSAESGVHAGRQRLRLLEQRILFQAVSAYMNVLRDTAIVQLHDSNVRVLTEQLRQTKLLLEAGQITPTDVAQAEARRANGEAMGGAARAALETSIGAYRQTIGEEPKRLAAAASIEARLPKTRQLAEVAALAEHPVILAAQHDADAADIDIRIVESDFMPKLSVLGRIYTQSDWDGKTNRAVGGAVLGKLSVPLYDGGATSSRMRQAKETAGQKRLDVDASRLELIALVRTNWGALQAAKTQIAAAQVQIKAAERALYGVREEAKAGQRTGLDILNAQLELLNARILLVTAQRDQIVASYAVLAATGRLSARALGLATAGYDPAPHFDQVKDGWAIPFTPSGQ